MCVPPARPGPDTACSTRACALQSSAAWCYSRLQWAGRAARLLWRACGVKCACNVRQWDMTGAWSNPPYSLHSEPVNHSKMNWFLVCMSWTRRDWREKCTVETLCQTTLSCFLIEYQTLNAPNCPLNQHPATVWECWHSSGCLMEQYNVILSYNIFDVNDQNRHFQYMCQSVICYLVQYSNN